MKQAGFTLMESMITVLIVGILMSIAIPSYNDYVIRSNRTEAMNGLLDMMRAQENYFANEFTYTTDLTHLNYNSVQDTYSGVYKITSETCGTDPLTECVKLIATPQGTQANDGTMTLTSRGERTHGTNTSWPK